MKKITLIAAAAFVALAASAQTKVSSTQSPVRQPLSVRTSPAVAVRDFVRPMPCLNNRGEVIAKEMGTICLPYVPQVEGATLYELVKASSTEFVFREVTDPQANTPYVFRVNEGVSEVVFGGSGEYMYNVSDVYASAAGVDDAFVGSYRTHVVNEPLFYLNGDQIRYTDQPLYTTRFRAYFKASILPEGTVLSPNVQTRFINADGTAAMSQLEVENTTPVKVSRQNIGLQQGTYQLGGKRIEVK